MNAPQPRRGAFTLLELVVVIAVIAILMTVLAPAFASLGRSSNLTSAAGNVMDELNLARQTALARNRVVEVRFYSLNDELGGARAYRAFRTLISDEAGDQLAPLGAMKRFPVSVVALDDQKYSTLLSDEVRTRRSDEVEDLPGAPKTPYKSIRFRPTGGAELGAYTSTNDNWFLTLKNERDPTADTLPAASFATIQLDPVNGRARQLRP